MDDYYINEHPDMPRAKRLRFSTDGIDGSIRDLIILAHEASDDMGYNRFRIFVTKNGTAALEFYDGLVAPRVETEEQEQQSWLSKLRRKYGKS